ncbi:hypothetical protein AGMMS49944_25370 [Spirochaetia bacterium]|nr:hypothetical protein AGMMS49944_25370 [Spirochaetia bacterium]
MGENKNKESIQDIIENARKQIAEEKNLSPAIRATFDVLIALLSLLVEKRIPKNSKNSSIPPSADPNREKKLKEKSGKKPGGQFGHKGSYLEPVKNPDHVVPLKVDRSKLPPGNWKFYGVDRRQLFEIKTYLDLLSIKVK